LNTITRHAKKHDGLDDIRDREQILQDNSAGTALLEHGTVHAVPEPDGRFNRLKRLAELGIALSGDPIDVFRHIAGMIGELLDVTVVNLSEIRGDELFFLSTYVKGDVQTYTGTCKLEHTPCATVQEAKDLRVYHDVMAKFPEAVFLQAFNAYTYCGFPALDGNGTVVAVICILDDKQHDFSEEDKDLLRVLAHRVGLELERQKYLDEHARKDAELQRAVQRAEEQRDFTYNLLQNSAIATFVLDTNHRILIWNSACEELTGVPAADMVGTSLQWKPFYDHQRPVLADILLDGEMDQLSTLYPEHSRSVLIPDGLHGERWLKNLNGRDRYIVFDASPIRNSGGSIIAAIETLQDFTRHKMLEEEVLQVKQDWEDTFNTITDMVTVHDKDFNIIRANKAAEQILDLPVLSASPVKCYEKYHGTLCPPSDCASCHSLKTALPTNVEVFEPHLNKFIEIRAIPRIDGKNNIVGLIHVVRDITKRKTAEDSLQAHLNFLQVMIDTIPTPVFYRDANGVFLGFNKAFEHVVGKIDGELIGKTIDDVVPRQIADMYHEADMALLQQDDLHHTYESSVLYADGSAHDVIFNKAAFQNPDGSPGGVVEVMIDISERKKLEEQLFHAQKMEAVGQLAGGIAHDFNNILSAIIGYGSILQMRIKQGDPLRHKVDQIIASADRAAHLTQGLLSFSRKQIINPKPIKLNGVVEKARDFLTRLIGEDIELKTVLSSLDPTVLADAGQIEQVLMNLATNARDVMPDGGTLFLETDTVELDEAFAKTHTCGKPGTYVLLSVTDSGCGMDEQTRTRIFEPFFTTKELGKGTGLGLAIVYGIIKQHRGSIHVYSEKGMGTTFKVYLPLIHDEVESKKEVVREQEIVGGKETILVAEDDATVRKLVVTVLRSFGYTVIEAADGSEAVMRFSEHADSIDLVLTDTIMPKMNGRDACAEMRKIRQDVPALFTSGYSKEVLRKKKVIDEDPDFILKPVTPRELLRRVREILDRPRPGSC
jgi:PAS domain S-box-containing protein